MNAFIFYIFPIIDGKWGVNGLFIFYLAFYIIEFCNDFEGDSDQKSVWKHILVWAIVSLAFFKTLFFMRIYEGLGSLV